MGRKGSPAAAAANSFQAREGATGVIGHNLVDSLIYKQSLMKFLVFINNALQPRARRCVPGHRYPGIRRSLSASLSLRFPLPLLLLHPSHFPAHTPMQPLPRVPSSSNTLYRPGFQPTPPPALSPAARSPVLDERREYVTHFVAVTVSISCRLRKSVCLLIRDKITRNDIVITFLFFDVRSKF